MIPRQLELFEYLPKPPRKIREDDPPADKPAASPTETTPPAAQELPFEPAATPVHAAVAEASSAEQDLTEAPTAVQPETVFSVSEPSPTPIRESGLKKVRVKQKLPADENAPDKQDVVQADKHTGEPEGQAALQVPEDELLYRRQYYTMRETATMFGISHSMLRYWENEFDILQPRKNRKGDRYFRPADIKNLQLIYHLLKVRKFTIDGAREYLRNHNKALDTFDLIKKLEKLKSFLLEMKSNL